MEKVTMVDDKVKKRIGIIYFIPAIAFGISLIYYLILLLPLLHGHVAPKSVVAITSSHYDTLFLMLATSSVISACVLLYCIVHLVKLTTLNTQTKMIWALLLVCLVPFSFIMFWYLQVKKEPKNMPVYSDIS